MISPCYSQNRCSARRDGAPRACKKKKKKKKLLKQILRGYYIYAACLLMEYSDTLGTIKINELKKSESK